MGGRVERRDVSCSLFYSLFKLLTPSYIFPFTSLHPPTHKQFFDESIIAKLNRSKTQLKKGDTAFLDDMRDVITETFNPPPPSNWYVRAGYGRRKQEMEEKCMCVHRRLFES